MIDCKYGNLLSIATKRKDKRERWRGRIVVCLENSCIACLCGKLIGSCLLPYMPEHPQQLDNNEDNERRRVSIAMMRVFFT